MTRRSNSEEVLWQLVRTARSAPEPPIDYERLQASVRRQWIDARIDRSRRLVHWRWVGSAAVAVSFFIGGWYGHAHHQKSETPVAVAVPSVPTIDGRALQLDQELEAGREPLTVNHPGVARWTLVPGGKARLAAKGKFLTVQLDSGTIEADVIPSTDVESFAIEAGALRVAVHGTSFSVTKTIDSVVVVVTAGTVVVGPSGAQGQTVGTLLHAPARQRFTASVAPIPQASAALEDPSEGSVSQARNKPSAATTAAPAPVDHGEALPAVNAEFAIEKRPTPVAIETALDTVRGAVARCFADAKGSDPLHDDSHVSVRVETHLTITLSPSGSLADIAFAPPIPSAIVECARREISNFSTTPTTLGATASRQLMLTK